VLSNAALFSDQLKAWLPLRDEFGQHFLAVACSIPKYRTAHVADKSRGARDARAKDTTRCAQSVKEDLETITHE
jgi:hypothetical protein